MEIATPALLVVPNALTLRLAPHALQITACPIAAASVLAQLDTSPAVKLAQLAVLIVMTASQLLLALPALKTTISTVEAASQPALSATLES